jgi:hypothetical protein
MPVVHQSWIKSIGAVQICDGCNKKPVEKVVYSCTICRKQICRACATEKKLEQTSPMDSVVHTLDSNSVDWSRRPGSQAPQAHAAPPTEDANNNPNGNTTEVIDLTNDDK